MMGDLRGFGGEAVRSGSPPVGTFRGSRRVSLGVNFHRLGDPTPIVASRFVVNATWDKRVDGTAGNFTLSLRERQIAGTIEHYGPGVAAYTARGGEWEWSSIIRDDDWVRIALHDGYREWLVMVGLVDSVTRAFSSVGGAKHVEYTVVGRDVTKVLDETELLMMPYASYDPILGYGAFYGAVNALSNLGSGVGPGAVVKSLFEYMMRAGPARTPGALWWRLPESIPASFTGRAPGLEGRQASDIIDNETWLDTDLAGTFSAYGSLLAKPASGGKAWDLIRDHANLVLNECFIDLRPPIDAADSPLAYAASTSLIKGLEQQAHVLKPALVLREKPFPSLPGTARHRGEKNDPWSRLPTTIMDVADCKRVSLTRNGSERYNYFFVESGTGASMAGFVLAQASLQARGGVQGSRLFEGVPAIDVKSVSRHGLRRLEQNTLYVNTREARGENNEGLDIFAGWTRLLRDWYALNHEFQSGTIETKMPIAGVRVGERLVLHGVEEVNGPSAPLECYVEGVTGSFSVDEKGTTTYTGELTVTRGHPNILTALAEHIVNFKVERGGSALVNEIVQGIRTTAGTLVNDLAERFGLAKAEADAVEARELAAEVIRENQVEELSFEDLPEPAEGEEGYVPPGAIATTTEGGGNVIILIAAPEGVNEDGEAFDVPANED